MISQATVFVIDDDEAVRDSLFLQLDSAGFAVETFPNCADFLDTLQLNTTGCIILDVRMPGMSGPELQAELVHRNISLPIIFLTGYGDIPLAVKTIQAGAFEFLTKPVDGKKLLECINAALALNAEVHEHDVSRSIVNERLKSLSEREREVLTLALEGYSNKDIGRRLDISFRTVEHHRSRILLKTGTNNLLQLSNLIKDRH